MLQSGYATGREIRSMSFTETYQLLSTNWLLCGCVGVKDSVAVASLRQGTCAIVGHRPDHSEPRENKRRPKILKLTIIRFGEIKPRMDSSHHERYSNDGG